MTKIAAKEREKQKIGMVRSCYYRGAIVVYYLMGWMYEPRDWERRRTRGTLYVLSRSFQYREPCNYHLAAISLSVVYQSISRYQESSRRLVLNSWGGPSILFIEIKTKKKKKTNVRIPTFCRRQLFFFAYCFTYFDKNMTGGSSICRSLRSALYIL